MLFLLPPLSPHSLSLSLSLSLSSTLSLSPEEDPVIRQFREEASEEDLFAELQAANGIDYIIIENEKLIVEK